MSVRVVRHPKPGVSCRRTPYVTTTGPGGVDVFLGEQPPDVDVGSERYKQKRVHLQHMDPELEYGVRVRQGGGGPDRSFDSVVKRLWSPRPPVGPDTLDHEVSNDPSSPFPPLSSCLAKDPG